MNAQPYRQEKSEEPKCQKNEDRLAHRTRTQIDF